MASSGQERHTCTKADAACSGWATVPAAAPSAAHLKQLVDNHGEGVDVDAAVVGLVPEHLGRHVAVGAWAGGVGVGRQRHRGIT